MKSDKTIDLLYNDLINKNESNYSEIYEDIKKTTLELIDNIILNISNYENLDKVLDYTGDNINIFGKDYINIKNLIYPPEPGDKLYNSNNPYVGMNYYNILHYINFIFTNTSIIANDNLDKNKIPKWWNLTQYNKEIMTEFVTKNKLVIHNDVFIQKSIKNSFNKYLKYNHCFNFFLTSIRNYSKDLDLLVGIHNKTFNKSRADRFQKYSFVLLIDKMFDYINSLEDSDTENYNKLNDYLLSIDSEFTINNCIDILTEYTIEIIINILQEYNDPTWIMTMSNNLLKEQLSIQKEREKLDLTGKLDKMNADQRYVYVKKQTIGAVNWWKNASVAAEKYINSEEYNQSTIKQRQEYLNNLYKQYQEETSDVLEKENLSGNINTNQPVETQQQLEEEGYYNEDDIDNEGEGEEYITMNLSDDES